MIEDPRGQWAHPGKNTRIPGNQITMEGVDYPVWAVPDVGEPVLMQPGQSYTFPGASYVDEYPMLEQGGELPKAQIGINGTLEPITLDNNPTDNMDPSGSGMNMDIEGIRNNLSPFIRDYVPYKDLQNAYFWERNQEDNKEDLTYGNPNSVSKGGQLPTAKEGGEYETKELTDAEIKEYVKGGYIVEEELPKAKRGLAKLAKYFKPKPIPIPKPSVTPTIRYNPKDMNYHDVHNSLRRAQNKNKLKFAVLKEKGYDGLFPSTYAKRRDGINEIESLINERTSLDENFKITHDNLTDDYVKKINERNRIRDRKEAVERMEMNKIVDSNPSPDQLEFIKKYPSYSTWLYKNDKGDLIGDYKNAFDSNIVDDAIEQQSTFVRGVKNAPNEEVAKQWLTTLGDVKAENRQLLNLGDAVYGSNATGLMESFGRGNDVGGNFGGLLKLDLGLDGLPPIEKIEGFEKAVRQASDMVSIPGYPNISIKDVAALNKHEELRNLGIKAIDSMYTPHSSERGVIDDAIIKIDKLIDLSNIGTTKPLGSGGMWGYINGEAIKADEELFHHVNNIPNLHTAWASKEAKDEWMIKWRKIHMKLSTIHDDLYNQMINAKGKLDEASIYKDHNKEEIAILTENLLQMQKELKGKLQKTIGQTGLGIGIGLFGVGLYNAEPTERSKKRRLERIEQRKNKKRKLVNNKPFTKNTNSPLPKNMLGGELSQDQYNDTPEFDRDLPEIVNSKEHGVDTPVYVQVEEKESPIHGTGVFSKEPISKGQSIGVSHIRKEFEKNGKMYQAPFPSKQIGGYNHSEEPNVTEVDNGDHISLIAIRDIQPGEELVSNYDDSEIQDMERSSDFIRKNNPKAQDGYIVKQRRGVRNNPDGSESTHLMNAEYVDGRGWVGFPSLFQDSKPYANDQENWKEISRENGWWPIYQEALKRGEVYDFGEDKEAALAFGRGSWKDQLPEHLQDKQKGGFQLELTPEEIDKYVKGGYVVEELPKANGGKTIKALAETNKYFKKILTGDEIEKLKGVYSYINENNANIINRLPQLRKANDLIKLWASDKNQIALKKGTGMIYPGLELANDKSKIFFTPYRDKSSRHYMDLEFDSEELLKKLYEQQDLIKLGESYLNNYHKIGNKYPIIKIPIETNYGKDFTFRTNKQGFVESPLPHFYHGVGHPSSDFNLENLEFDRNKIDVNKLKGWTDTGKKHRRVAGDGEYGLFGSMNLNTWRDPALKYSSRDRAIFDLVKDPSKRPDDFGILKKIYLSPNAKLVSVNTPYVKEALKDINYSNSYRDRLQVSGRNKGMTPQKAAILKSKWDIDGIIDTEWGELAVFNPDAITGVSDTKFKLFDYIDPITGLLNQNIHTAQKINNKLINNYSANFITPHRNMLSSVKSRYDGIPNYYNFGLNSEKVYVPQSLLSNKVVDMPVPSGSTLQPFSKEWWEAAKPNIDLIRKQGGELPKAQVGTWLSKAGKLTKYFKPKPKVVSKIINRSITPIGYDPFTVAAAPLELLTPKALKYKPKTFATKNRFDAWKVYNGLKPDFNTFSRNADGTLAINDFRIDKNTLQSIISNPKSSFGTMEIENQLNFGGVHGNGMITKGKDKLGKFIDFTDTWDLQPFKNFKNLPKKARNFEVSSLTSGKPFDLKNRIYYDDSGNFFDHNKNKLIEEIQHFPIGQVKRDKAVDLKMLSTPNVVGVKQMDVIHDWDKATNQKFAKGAGVAGGLIFSGMGFLEWLRQKENEEYSLKNKQNEELTPNTLEEKKLGGELPKANGGLISLANLAKPLITGASSSNKIIKGLSRGVLDKGIDILPFLASKTMKKYAIDAARRSSGQGDYNIAKFLEDINEDYSGGYMGQDVDHKNIHGKGAHKGRDLIDLYFNANESNFSELPWLSELENKNALKKYTDYHGPLKSYKLLSEMGNGEYISGYNMLANEIEIANPSVISKPGDRYVDIDYSVGDGIYTRRGHDTYKDFGLWSSKIVNDAKKQNNPDKIIKAYNQIFDRFGDVIPFEVNSGYNHIPKFKLNNNPINHIDDIAGHMAFLRRNSPNSFDLTTRDVWGFHPVDYSKKWLEDPRDKRDPWIQGLGSKLFNKFGKPFVLTQTNPLHFDFKKGGELPKANGGKWIKYLKPVNQLNIKRPINLNTWKNPIVTGSIVDELGIDVSNLVNATRFDINNLHDINQTRPIDFDTDKLLNSILNDYPLINSDPLYIDKLAKLSSSNPKANFIMPDFGNSLHPELAYAMKHSPNIKTFLDPDLSWTEFVKNQRSYRNGEGLLIKNLEGWDPVNQKDVSLTYNVNEGIMSKVDPIYQTGRFRGHPNRGVNQHNHLLGMTGNYPSIIASGDNIFTSSGKKRWGERTAKKLANDWDYPGMPVTQDWVNKLLGQKKSSNWMSGSPRLANMLDQSFQINKPLQDKVFMKFIYPKRKLGGELPKANGGKWIKYLKPVDTYNKIVTGNSVLPYALKLENSIIPKSTDYIKKITKEQIKEAQGFLRRRQFIKNLQKEGLIGENFNDLNYAARSTKRTEELTKLALDHNATRYRAVTGKVPHDGKGMQEHTRHKFDMSVPNYPNSISEFENMKNAGVDFNDPLSIAKYQVAHVPMDTYGYRSGMHLMHNVDALFATHYPDMSGRYGNYQFKMKSPRDFSEGSYNDWFSKYYKPNKTWKTDGGVKDGYYVHDYMPSNNYDMPLHFSASKSDGSVVGLKGSKMFDIDETYPFADLVNLNPQQKLDFVKYIKQNKLDFDTGWKGKYEQGGDLPKAKYGKWMKYLNPPNSITTSKKFLFTPPEELLRTEAAWNMMRNNNYYSLGRGAAEISGLRDFGKQLTSRYDHAKFANKVKQFDKAIDRVTYDKRLSESAKEAKIDELVKAQNEVQKKLFNIQDEYSKFRLDYSGLPITQARGKHGDQLAGGQGRLFNNLLNDKEYIKFGKFFGDENDMQNLINAGKKFNSSYAEAAFPTEAFRVGEDNLQNSKRFVQFMPKLDYSSGLSVDSDVIYNTVKELNDLGVGLDYMGLDNIGSVGDKLGLVDLSYIGKPGERNSVFNINPDVFLPDVTNNKLGSKELVREIREMLVPGTGVKDKNMEKWGDGRWKEGGSVELGDIVDEATMKRLKAQGYTFEEI